MKKLFINGKFYLEREKFAEAVLVNDDIIEKIGTTSELENEEVAQVIDLNGATALPGLNDSHCHISCIGAGYVQVDLSECTSIDEIVDKTRKFIDENYETVKDGMITMGLNQDLFTEGERRFLNRHDLDRISTDIPLVLERVCGHICAINSKMIEKAGITADMTPPEGGTIELTDGEVNGILTENAVAWIEDFVPDYSLEQKVDFMSRALNYAASVGITSVQSNDVNAPNVYGDFPSIRAIYERELSKVRYTHQITFYNAEQMDEFLEGEAKEPIYRGNILNIGPVKMFKDGSLGAKTAQMIDGYVGEPDNHGVCALDLKLQKKLVKAATEREMQVITHVIGDLAVKETVEAYADSGFVDGKNKLRHGLVHCQITSRELLEDIAKKDITVFYQPIFLDYDIDIVEAAVGEELAKTSYAFKTLGNLGAHIGYGTDAPVEDINPWPNIYAAVTRQKKNGEPKGGFVPEEKVDIYTAIDDYTIGSAYLEFKEDIKGRIRENYLADFTIIDEDIFNLDLNKIKDIKCKMTVIGGEIVYKRA